MLIQLLTTVCTGIVYLGVGGAALLAIIAGIHIAEGKEIPAQLKMWTWISSAAVVASALMFGIAAAVSALQGQAFDPQGVPILLVVFGFIGGIAGLIAYEVNEDKLTVEAYSDSNITLQKISPAAVVASRPPARADTRAVVSAMDAAADIRNPVTAWTNKIATNAQIQALGDAARLATVTAQTAEAEITGLDAILRRDEKFAEFEARQQFRGQLLNDKIHDQQDAVTEAGHRRELAAKRREREAFEAERAALSAKHGVDAERKFKKPKFDLGEKRMKARMADVDVDTATANAASRKMGAGVDTAVDGMLADLRKMAENLRQQILSASAEGKDTAWLRAQLAHVEGMLAK